MTDDIKPVLTEQDIEDIIMTGGHSNVAGGIYATSVYAFAKEVAIAAVLADREGRQQWISVDERLPEPGIDVLVRCDYHGRDAFDVAGIFHGEWASHVTEHDCRHTVTHWQPLPAPPADAQRAKEPT